VRGFTAPGAIVTVTDIVDASGTLGSGQVRGSATADTDGEFEITDLALSDFGAGLASVTSKLGDGATTENVGIIRAEAIPLLTNGTISRAGDASATIGFTSNKAGKVYYLAIDAVDSSLLETTVEQQKIPVLDSNGNQPVDANGNPVFETIPAATLFALEDAAPDKAFIKDNGTDAGSLNGSGAVSGWNIALTAGDKDVYVVLADENGTLSEPLKLTTGTYPPAPAAPTITTTTLTGGTVGMKYSQTLASTGDAPITWSITDGALPGGLSLNTDTGVISGTPTTAGSANFSVTATNGNGTSPAVSLGITIAKGSQTAPVGLGKTDETAAGNDGTIIGVTTAMQYKLSSVSSYTACASTAITNLAPGTYLVRYAETTDYNASADMQIVIAAYNAPLAFADRSAYDIPASTVGTAIASIDVSGGASGGTPPYTFTATGFPSGISISTAGVISGAPTVAGATGTSTITVTDRAGATQNITINYGKISTAPTTQGGGENNSNGNKENGGSGGSNDGGSGGSRGSSENGGRGGSSAGNNSGSDNSGGNNGASETSGAEGDSGIGKDGSDAGNLKGSGTDSSGTLITPDGRPGDDAHSFMPDDLANAALPPEVPAGEPFFIKAPEGSLAWDESLLEGGYDTATGGYFFTARDGVSGEVIIIYTDGDKETPLTISIGDATTPLASGEDTPSNAGFPWWALAGIGALAAVAVATLMFVRGRKHGAMSATKK
jgi:hypothetical protein